MAEAPKAEYAEAAEISFELEQLTLTDDHRLELTGRWFGVRGRRFMRPALTLIAAGTRSRLLADLEHKPWAAEDGESWVAAFPLQAPTEEVLELELAVAPDIAVMLAPPPELAQLPRARVASSDAVVAPRTSSPPTTAAPQRNEVDTALEDELTAARAALEEQRLKIAQLEHELERAADAGVQLRSALSRRDAAMEKLDETLRERDEARTGWKKAHEGWRRALLERDQAPVQSPVPSAPPAPLESSHPPAPIQRGRASPGAVWARRAFALLLLLAVVITIVMIVQSA